MKPGLANVLILVVLYVLILYKKNFCGCKNVLIFSYIILINYFTLYLMQPACRLILDGKVFENVLILQKMFLY